MSKLFLTKLEAKYSPQETTALLILLPGASKEVNDAIKALQESMLDKLGRVENRLKTDLSKSKKDGEFKEFRKALREQLVTFTESLLQKT